MQRSPDPFPAQHSARSFSEHILRARPSRTGTRVKSNTTTSCSSCGRSASIARVAKATWLCSECFQAARRDGRDPGIIDARHAVRP